MRILNKPQTKFTSYHFSFFSCIKVQILEYYIYRPTIRCLNRTLLYIDQPSDASTLPYYIQTNHQMSPLQTIIYRPTARCLHRRLLYIDHPSDVSTIEYNIYRPTIRCLHCRLICMSGGRVAIGQTLKQLTNQNKVM